MNISSDILPIFTSHYSGRSILTLDQESPEVGPRSIFDICVKNGISDVFLCETGMTGFLEAYENSRALGLNLRYGLKLVITNDATKKEESEKFESKIIFFIKNEEGYKDLIRIWMWANEFGFYYYPRIDWNILETLLTDNLVVAMPYYDSFVAVNLLTISEIFPKNLPKNCTFFIESNGLPMDSIIWKQLKGYAENCPACVFQKAKSVYYEKREDFMAYQTFRCILNRSNLSSPDMRGMCSDSFCFEEFLEKNNGQKN